MGRYFRLKEDMTAARRWLLGTPVDDRGEEAGSWLFMRGQPVAFEGGLRVPIEHPGEALDFSLADIGAVPVVTERVARVLSERASDDVQLFPVKVDSLPGPYFLVNVARTVRCIDDEASEEVQHWQPEDGQPERVGEYRAVAGMRIHSAQASGVRVFRTWGWRIALIVSEEIKEALVGTGATGLVFSEVTGSG